MTMMNPNNNLFWTEWPCGRKKETLPNDKQMKAVDAPVSL